MTSWRRPMLALVLALQVWWAGVAHANPTPNYDTYFLPDMFSIDRTPVSCGATIFELDKSLPVVGVNKGNGHIVLNPDILAGMPGVLKLYVAEHECAYSVVGRKSEAAAACWAVRNGRDLGWFPPESFKLLLRVLQHPEAGWPPALDAAAITALKACYAG